MDKVLLPRWPAPDNVKAFVTLRDYDLAELERLPAKPYLVRQVHGADVVWADAVAREDVIADAVITRGVNIGCVVRTADCLPVLISDAAGTQVAAVHAGWRGLAAGVLANTCSEFGSSIGASLAWLGPAIGPERFEVGAEVLDTFVRYGWERAVLRRAFVPVHGVQGKWLVNLYELARHALVTSGMCIDGVYGGEWCTYTQQEQFFSHRRNRDIGRMYSMIYLQA